MVVLKDETDAVTAQTGQSSVIECGGCLAIDRQGASSWPVEQTDYVEQGAFAGTGWPDHGAKLALLQRQVDTMQHLGFDRCASVVGLAHAA